VNKRYLFDQLSQDLAEKRVFLGGPRQVGKTTLAKSLGGPESYMNWDDGRDRQNILKYNLPKADLWIFDEIHKYKKWRNFVKGLFDKRQKDQKILVTGSARLDLYRRGGDSLQGRYHFLRLHPFTLDELGHSSSHLEQLYELGGFPEPLFKSRKMSADRWSQEYRQRLLQEDISSIEQVQDLGTMELLLMRLPDLVGGTLSLNSLREDLQVSHRAVKSWLDIFERCYGIFRLSSFGGPTIKAVKKEQKHYHFDWNLISEAGPRFENMMAVHLLKWCNFLQDTTGKDLVLNYYRDLNQREVDFVVTLRRKPILFIEAKSSFQEVSPHLKFLKRKFPSVSAYQVHFRGHKDFVDGEGIRCGPALKLLPEIQQKLNSIS
jgi:uncharacterized protein